MLDFSYLWFSLVFTGISWFVDFTYLVNNHFKFTTPQDVPLSVQDLGKFPRWPICTLIDLTLKFKSIHPARFQRILKLCPKLIQLDISKCYYPATIEDIQRVCPRLQYLGFNYEEMSQKGEKELHYLLQKEIGSRNDPVLRHIRLRISRYDSFTDKKPILRLFACNAPIIETLYLQIPSEINTSQIIEWNPLSTLSFDNIRYLCLVFDSLATVDIIAKILSRCPQVESLHLIGPSGDSIFQSISHYTKKLKTLELGYTGVEQKFLVGLGAVFRAFAARGHTSSLQKIILSMPFISNIDHMILAPLANISTLQEIDFRYLQLDQESFQSFLKAVASQHHRSSMLQSITLKGIECVNDESLLHISKIQSLRKLTLQHITGNVTPDVLEYIKSNKNIVLVIKEWDE